MEEEEKKEYEREIDHREKLVFCPKCQSVVSGRNDGIVLGFYNFLSLEADFSAPISDETRERYENMKRLQNQLVDTLSEIEETLEDYEWTTGKYFRKIAQTHHYAKSYTKTFQEKIESGRYYEDY